MAEGDKVLTDLSPKILYEGWGMNVREEFVGPALQHSTSYDRLTGYFNVNSLLAVAEGLDELWRRGGKMRLIIGIHDIPREVIEAERLDEETVETIVESIRTRLLEEVSTIEDEFQRDKLATLAWMLNDGLLRIRVACPLQRNELRQEGIFHKKRLIFRDDVGNVLVGVGSPNETAAGFSENIEDLTVFRSWEDGQEPFVEKHIESFERLWDNEREYLHIINIDAEFGEDILERLGSPDRHIETPVKPVVQIGEIIEKSRDCPAYSVLSFENIGLYPHQERVFVEALSRWPVRVMLADEVGLGKTIEAGAILSYLLRFADVEEVTILAPANLLKQWHEELYLHFGLEFWRWDSTNRVFISPEGERWEESLGGNPVGPEAPPRVLISAQLARGTKKKGHIFEDTEEIPDVLLVDEAHAARLRPDLDGRFRPTRLWRTLDDIVDQVPHVIFLTATPLQTNLEEYHGLLNLLGLPELWQDLEAYERSLKILAKGEEARSLRNAQWVLRLIEASVEEMAPQLENLSSDEKDLLEVAKKTGGSPSLDEAKKVMANWSSAYNLLIRVHPAHLLTLRNSRAALVERGYRFPERKFEAPALAVPQQIERFYDGLHEYIWEAFGEVEKAADPDRQVSLGFTKSSYHQRTASSLYSAISSLQNRLEKVENIVEGFDTDEEILGEEYEEPDMDEENRPERVENGRERRRLERAKSIESTYINDLLGQLEDFVEDGWDGDPKIMAMIDLLENHLPGDAVLVFSRYTDTLDACLQAFKAHQMGEMNVGFGMYTGSEAWITQGGKRSDATKEDVKIALEEGDIRLVFCSEAAAEGLNLQAARVMINIDVPWNPAKLEQRIGRIARLGQPAEEVLIYNLWYPESVESKMYGRLTERKDLYDIAVGQSPEIISNAIRSRVSQDQGRGQINAEEAIERLGDIRQSIQHEAIQRVWGSDEDREPLSTKVRRELLELIGRSSPNARISELPSGRRLVVEDPSGREIEAGADPEDRSILTLNHPAIQLIEGAQGFLPRDEDVLVVEESSGQTIAFCIEKGELTAIVPPHDFPDFLSALIQGESTMEFLEEDVWFDLNGSDLLSRIRTKSLWLPNHDELDLQSNAPAPDELPVLSREDSLQLRKP